MLQTGLPKRGSQHSDELIELAIAVRDQGFQRPAARARLAGCSNVTISCAWLDNQPIPKFPRQRLKNCCPSRAEPKVRIHLPPAKSLQTLVPEAGAWRAWWSSSTRGTLLFHSSPA